MNRRSFISASVVVMVGMMAGRMLGMVREMTLAAHFGAGETGDMAIILLMIPDFVTSALIGSAMSSALVPAFAQRTPPHATALLMQALLLSVGTFTLAVLALCAFLPNDGGLFATPLLIALAAIPLAVATAVLTAYLQYRARFVVPAFATVSFNAVIIASLLIGAESLVLLALAVFAASAIRFLPHAVAYVRVQPRPRFIATPWQIDRGLVRIYLLAMASGILGLLPLYAPYAIVARFGDSIAVFNYAFKLVLLPALLGQTIIQLVVLPWLVTKRSATTHDASPVRLSLEVAWLFGFSAALCLSVAAHPVATLFFGYGKMLPGDIDGIAALFAIGVWAVPAMLLSTLWQVIFYSAERSGPPLIANAVQALLIVPVCWLAYGAYGLAGVMAAFVGLQSLCACLLALLAYRSHLSTRLLPRGVYFVMTLVMGLLSVPVIYLFSSMAVPAWAGVVFAAGWGIISLAAGAMASPTLRHQLRIATTHENDPHH